MIYEHFKKTLIFIGRTTTPSISFASRQFEIAFFFVFAIGMLPKKGQGMPCPYRQGMPCLYVSTFGYRYVAFNSYWFYASRVFDLQPLTNVSKNHNAKINILIIQKTKKYIFFNTLQILYHTMFLVMF
jgi:hypothetical protein